MTDSITAGHLGSVILYFSQIPRTSQTIVYNISKRKHAKDSLRLILLDDVNNMGYSAVDDF